MILNEKLTQKIMLTKGKSETAYETILTLIESTPNGDWSRFNSTSSIRLESCGTVKNEFGIWDIWAELDEDSKISALTATFSGEKSSRKPYADQYTISLSTPSEKTFRKHNLVTLTQTRFYNYRFMNLEKSNLSARDIAKLSRSATIYSFSLSEALDPRTKETYLLSSEKSTAGLYTHNSSTLGKSEEILEA